MWGWDETTETQLGEQLLSKNLAEHEVCLKWHDARIWQELQE
jgi:hypothetical protein